MAFGFARISAPGALGGACFVRANRLKSLRNLFCPFVHGSPRREVKDRNFFAPVHHPQDKRTKGPFFGINH